MAFRKSSRSKGGARRSTAAYSRSSSRVRAQPKRRGSMSSRTRTAGRARQELRITVVSAPPSGVSQPMASMPFMKPAPAPEPPKKAKF